MSTMIHPYLFFGGRCEEAIAFYKNALGAETKAMMRYNQSPDPVPPGILPPGFDNKVMHADVSIRGIPVMMSDGLDDRCKFDGFRLALILPTEAEAHQAFGGARGGRLRDHAAVQNVLVALLRHADRQIRPRLDADRCGRITEVIAEPSVTPSRCSRGQGAREQNVDLVNGPAND